LKVHTNSQLFVAGTLDDENTNLTPDPGEEPADETTEDVCDVNLTNERPSTPRWPAHRLALVVILLAAASLGTLAGWLGLRAYHSSQAAQQCAVFLQVGRQAALNLTTIDWQHAKTDVQRIIDSATGTFHDDFAQRSESFIDVVKQTQTNTVGSITEAGLESQSVTGAQVLVAVSVKTSNANAPQQNPRYWRMRIAVQKIGDEVKVSNVEFVP
jgi:Mce-associated membrane protein